MRACVRRDHMSITRPRAGRRGAPVIAVLASAAAVAAVAAVAAAMVAAVAAAGAEPEGFGMFLFTDTRARNVGDLITVLIVERSFGSNKAGTNTGKGVDLSAEGGGLFSFLMEADTAFKSKFSGLNQTQRASSLTAKMTARVVEVLPGGVLRIEGKQSLIVNKERQDITVTGFVRVEDISPDNTVLSTYVANAEIRYEGKLDQDQKKGLLGFLSRFFSGLFDLIF